MVGRRFPWKAGNRVVWTAVFLPHLHFAAHVADAVVTGLFAGGGEILR